MTVNAIIAEFNPLHKGHEYLISRGCHMTDADFTIAVMSGDFVQRGEPAIMDKYLRTESALLSGADLVLELPSYYAMSSADIFARAAVTLISKLNVADNLVFGCECDNEMLLFELADIVSQNLEIYNRKIADNVARGFTYPKAEAKAVAYIIENNADNRYREIGSYSMTEIKEILASPNNTLAICYLKALFDLDSYINPVAVKRITSDYHDLSLGALSSSAVRKELLDENYSVLSEQLPALVYELYGSKVLKSYPVSSDDFSDILIYKLRSLILGSGSSTKASAVVALTQYVDVTEALASRIINNINNFKSFTQFIAHIKTKNMTYAHISRALMHIVLGIKKSNLKKYTENDFSLYARILGFKKESAELLSVLKTNSQIPIVSKIADAKDIISSPLTLKLINENTFASDLYYSISSSKFKQELIPEYSRQIVII